EEGLALAHAERRALFGDQLEQQRADLGFGAGAVGRGERLEIEPVEQLAVNVAFELEIAGARRRRRRPRWWPGRDDVGDAQCHRGSLEDAEEDALPLGLGLDFRGGEADQMPGEAVELRRDLA